MRFPFIIVDQNQLQRADVVAVLVKRCRESNLQLLLPDVAGFEFSAVNDPHHTWFRCMEHIASHSELVVVSLKMTSLWRAEIKTGQPTATIVDAAATNTFRGILNQLSAGDRSGVQAVVDGPVNELLPNSLSEWSDHDKLKATVRTIHDSLKSSLPKETLKALRNDVEHGVIDWLSSTDGVRFVFQRIQNKGVESQAALNLAVTPSAIGAFISGIAALALDWLSRGGIESARPAHVTSDLHDLEYAILGSMSESLATNDKRPVRICNAIKIGLEARVEWVSRAIAVGPENA